ncbi:3-deoxy-manno-octulosonate cytidylyltransferase [Candidatus Pelagibacter communis]|uniref:3-deoxy-manno-octulosonate cytidylyltransferase n=1 Tax=Pelagibacter ubique TaxID=198252 RepID=UPI000AD6311F|nr:3-deoxy-manno-octulosonate cytidylyltransferase [Candidatus Pelagibacter ubique]
MKTLVIIPSRMSATRLPGKPLLKINGLSIISLVSKKAEEANIGDVIVATEDQEIVDDVKRNGFNAILTSNKHKTGTDRIHEAFKKSNIRDVDFIMNLQGDEPAIDIQDIVRLNDKMLQNRPNIGTLAAKMKDNKNLKNENIVKVITENTLVENNFPKGISFLRKSEKIDNIYHHIGVYCYSKDSLEKFVQLNQSKNEIENRLEQLRALDNNIDINVSLAKSSPIGVDTEEDYVALKKIMEYKN